MKNRGRRSMNQNWPIRFCLRVCESGRFTMNHVGQGLPGLPRSRNPTPMVASQARTNKAARARWANAAATTMARPIGSAPRGNLVNAAMPSKTPLTTSDRDTWPGSKSARRAA